MMSAIDLNGRTTARRWLEGLGYSVRVLENERMLARDSALGICHLVATHERHNGA